MPIIPLMSALNFLQISITSKTEPPVVITSSAMITFSPALISKPRLSSIRSFFLSVNIILVFNLNASIYPNNIPPIAGEMTAWIF